MLLSAVTPFSFYICHIKCSCRLSTFKKYTIVIVKTFCTNGSDKSKYVQLCTLEVVT